ncbi:unnamed protein product [Somion occarium]|uniref:Man(5)GlcNAc(2)-PP-dolichol translocation protein RFT1 n=1 Tax=Somion occarium TaxID=3059160 RepID=A0ABP1DX40_9APHY
MASPQPRSLLSASLASASSLVLLQLFSRVFTFVLNQALVRLVSPQILGTAAIQFELLLSTILFLSREGVRNALLRSSTNQQDTSTSQKDVGKDILVSNISLLPVLLGIPITVASASLYLNTSSSSTSSQPHFRLSVVIYALAAFFELLSEPLYIRAQNELRFDIRVRAEGTAVALKTFTAFIMLVTLSSDWALVAFAVGQAVYGLALLLSFLRVYGRTARFWPKKAQITVHDNSTKTQYFDDELLHLSAAMTGQSVVKHFLTEGDKFLVSRLSPLADQGGYAIASNYGSLVARIVFQPIEETSRVFFSKTLSVSSTPPPEAFQMASNILLTLLLLFTHLLLLLVTFAPPYLRLAVSMLLPPRYLTTSAPKILQTYVYYIPMMAFNGILEAFFASTATSADLRAQSRWMLVFSIGFVIAAVVLSQFLELGDAGLVWANIANLTLRAIYAWTFVKRFFLQREAGQIVSWTKAVPPLPVLVSFVLSAITTRWSESMYHNYPLSIRGQINHIAVGVACLAGCLTACFIFERKHMQQVFSVLRKA